METPPDSGDEEPEVYELRLLERVQEHLGLGRFRQFHTSGSNRLEKFPRLPVPPQPLMDEDLRYTIERDISDGGVQHTLQLMGRGASLQTEAKDEMNDFQAPAEQSATKPSKSAQPTAPSAARQAPQWNVMDMIFSREAGLNRSSNWSAPQRRGVLCPSRIPCHPNAVVHRRNGNAYTGRFTDDGELFVAGFQDQTIMVYEVQRSVPWKVKKRITARMLRWTITDTCLSPDSRFLLYSTISPVVNIVKIRGDDNVVESEANVTEIHEPLLIGDEDNNAFGIWSMAWSKDGRDLVVGTNGDQENVVLYDMEHRVTTHSVLGHTMDVNSVAFMDESSQVFVSGSDDNSIKIWDSRTFGESTQSVGTLVGHLEGVTHIDAKGDGRYLISNAKDQTIKLWDIRKLVSDETASSFRHLKNSTLPHFLWDYRWNEYPGKGFLLEHPRDASLMTFRGHSVLQTLIRAYFSPKFTTGQRYVYTGCRNGTIRIFDILTGETIHELALHESVVRDCAWHPYEMLFVSTSWDGRIVQWVPRQD